MNRRLHHAIYNSSEARALLVLFIVLALYKYRKLQRKWKALPTLFDIILEIDRRVNIWITHRLYKAHWL